MFRKKKKARRGSGSRHFSKFESLEHRLLLAADWQNPIHALDVDASDDPVAVTPMDALLVINELSDPTVSDSFTGILPLLDADDPSPGPPYVDVDGNGFVTPLDAMLVINELTSIQEDFGEFASNVGQAFNEAIFAPADVIAGARAALANGVEHDTLVNSVTERKQSQSDVAASPSGEIVIVWQSYAQDGSSWGVFGQRYSADGVKVGDEFAVNTRTKNGQRNPAVAMNEDGSFVVVWSSLGQDGRLWGVYGQQFNSLGEPVGGEFLVNQTTKGNQTHPDIAFLDGGDFVVSWEGRGVGDRNGIYVRQFELADDAQDAPTVTAVADEILVNMTTRGDQSRATVASLPGGDFVVAWHGRGSGDAHDILMRRLGDDSPTDEITVNDATDGKQKKPAVAVHSNGQLVVAWQQRSRGGNGLEAWVQRYDDVGDQMGDAILIKQTQESVQKGPAVAYLADGRFVVSWFGRGSDGHRGIFSRTFLADGSPSGDESLVNLTVESGQVRPAVAAVNDGHLVTWQGRGDGDKRGIFARFFETDTPGPFRINPIDDQTIVEGTNAIVQVSVTDTDGEPDAVTFSLDALTAPDGASIDPQTGEFTWSTTEADGPETYDIIVAATDGEFTDTEVLRIEVLEDNTAPQLAPIEDQFVAADNLLTFAAVATDADLPENNLVYSATLDDGAVLPAWLSLDTTTGTFSGTPTAADEGTLEVLVTVTDDGGLSDDQPVSINVTANSPPVVVSAIPDQVAPQDEAFSLDVSSSFNDPDGDVLTYAATRIDSGDGTLPSWLSFDPGTGVFTGTPTSTDAGGTIEVTASDPSGATASDSFTLVVSDLVNNAPVILDQVFHLASDSSNGTSVGTVLATDPDPSDVLAFSIVGGNDDGSFDIDASSGEITVVDVASLQDGDAPVLTVQASDGELAGTAAVTISYTSDAIDVAYQLEALDAAGNSITSVTPGEAFELRVTVQDLQDSARGVFSAFVDLLYPESLVMLDGEIAHSSTYSAGAAADANTLGLIDEAGGVDGVSDLGGDPFEVLRIPMVVAADVAVGTSVNFAMNEADNLVTHPTLIFGESAHVPVTRILFGSLTLMTVAP